MASHPSTAYQAVPPAVNLQEFAADLSASVNKAITQKGYTNVFVLAFHWENDTMGVAGLEAELLNLFRHTYLFQVENYVIPLVGSQLELVMHLGKWFKKYQGEDILRIIVYSGHASDAGTGAYHWELFGQVNNQGQRQGPSLNWWAVRDCLRGFDGDTCFIFDCCSAGSLALDDDSGDELISASGWEATAAANLPSSFTQALIDTLRNLNGAPATLAQIYATIFRLAHNNQVGACPVHIPHRSKPSITIARLGNQRVLGSTRKRPEAVMMIRARICADMPHDPTAWKAWLSQNIPPDVVEAGVTVEAVARGSCILILNVPVEVWTMLPRDDRTYTFIAHVSSGLMPISPQSFPSPVSFPFPVRPALPPARENSPPRSPHRQQWPREKRI